jgi:hypothetical protein
MLKLLCEKQERVACLRENLLGFHLAKRIHTLSPIELQMFYLTKCYKSVLRTLNISSFQQFLDAIQVNLEERQKQCVAPHLYNRIFSYLHQDLDLFLTAEEETQLVLDYESQTLSLEQEPIWTQNNLILPSKLRDAISLFQSTSDASSSLINMFMEFVFGYSNQEGFITRNLHLVHPLMGRVMCSKILTQLVHLHSEYIPIFLNFGIEVTDECIEEARQVNSIYLDTLIKLKNGEYVEEMEVLSSSISSLSDCYEHEMEIDDSTNLDSSTDCLSPDSSSRCKKRQRFS